MRGVFEIKLVTCKYARVQICSNFVFLFRSFNSTHNSGCQIDDVTQNWELFSRSWGANNTREAFSRRNSNVAVGVINFVQGFDHVEASQNGPCSVIVMSKRQESPQTNERAAFVVHQELVDWALLSVNLFLNFCDDLLDFVHSLGWACTAQLDTQAHKHDCYRAIFRAIFLLINI